MKKSVFAVFLSMMIVGFGINGTARAATIVDTGSSMGTFWTLHSNQWLAGEFTTSPTYPAYIITDVFGWIHAGIGGNVNIVLYGDGGEIPDSELYSAMVTVPTSGSGFVDPMWQGVSELDWTIDSGTYWISFEPVGSFSGVMPGQSPNPLINEAAHSFGSWHESDGIDIGVQIYGNPVPIPGAVLLFGSGLIGLAGFRKKFKK